MPKCFRTSWKHLDIKHLEKKMCNWKSKIERELMNIAISEVHADLISLDKKLKFLNRKMNKLIPTYIADKFRNTQKMRN